VTDARTVKLVPLKAPLSAKGFYSILELAEHNNLNPEVLRRHLGKDWRLANDKGWEEVQNRLQNQPKFRFLLEAVAPIIEHLVRGPGETEIRSTETVVLPESPEIAADS
jgi:hypothetical protein